MAYTKHTWECGEVITADKLNNIENGVADAEEASSGLKECCTEVQDSIDDINRNIDAMKEDIEEAKESTGKTVSLVANGDTLSPANGETFAELMGYKNWAIGDDATGVIAYTSSANGKYTVAIIYNGKVVVAESTNGTSVPSFDTSGKEEEGTIYGVEWDGTSTTKWSRTDAAAEFVDPEPAVANGTGSSPFDNIMPWAGMVKVEDAEAGTLVAIPKYWYKWTREGDSMKLQIANGEVPGFHVSPAHADRGDGKGERDVVYVGRYHCSAADYKSASGVLPKANQTRAAFRTAIHALGDDVWQYDFAMHWTIAMLYLVEFADWDSQSVIGYGCSAAGNAAFNMGATDDMQYHTGTDAATRTTYGSVQYRNIEGLWDNVLDWCDGIYFSDAEVMCINNPADFSDTTGGTLVAARATSSGYITKYSDPENLDGFEYALCPDAVGGTDRTYVCDYCYYSASGVVLRVGGDYNHYQDYGLFCFRGGNSASDAFGNIGSRLQKLPS